MLFYDGNFIYTENESDIAYYELIAELKLFLLENPMNTEAGVDYKGVLNGEKFLKTELNRVCEKHADNFSSFEIGEPTQNGENIECLITLTLLSGETKTINITI